MEDRLVELPKGWVEIRLEEVSEKITDGTHFTPTYMDKGIPFISVKDIFDGKISFDDCRYISDKEHQNLIKRCHPEYFDVLITKSGTIGRTAVVKTHTPFSLFVSVALIKPFKRYVNSDFMSFALRNYINSIDIQQSVKGGVIKNLHIEDLKEIAVPFPPLPEQHRIVAKIEELFTRLDAGVEALKKIKVQLKRYRQAVLKYAFEGKLTQEWRKANKGEIEPASVLLERIKEQQKKEVKGKFKELPPVDTSELPELPEGWVWANMGDICRIEMGQSPPGVSYNDGGVGVALINGPVEFGPSPFSKTVRTKFTSAPTKMCKENDLILCVRGSTTGRMNIAGSDACIGRGVAALRALSHQSYLNIYVHFVQRKIFELGTGSTFPNIGYDTICTIPFPLAPVHEQERIALEIEHIFETTDGTEKVIEQSLKQSDRLRQSILKRAFEGKLVPQDPTDEPAEKLLHRIKEEKAKREGENKREKKHRNKKSNQLELI